MEPQLRVVEQMERGIGDPFVLWHVANTEVVFAPI
jgi:hypothetical protein